MGLTFKELLTERRKHIKEAIKLIKPRSKQIDVASIYLVTEDELIQNVACGRALERYIKEKLNHEVDFKVLVKMVDEEVKQIMPEGDDDYDLG